MAADHEGPEVSNCMDSGFYSKDEEDNGAPWRDMIIFYFFMSIYVKAVMT